MCYSFSDSWHMVDDVKSQVPAFNRLPVNNWSCRNLATSHQPNHMHRTNFIQEKTRGTKLSQVKRNISQQFINNYIIQLHYKHLQKRTVFI